MARYGLLLVTDLLTTVTDDLNDYLSLLLSEALQRDLAFVDRKSVKSQLATDASAVRYLPYCLSSLTAECLLPSSHLVKWATRIHALLHSKDAGARWAGLCLAHKTSILSQKTMIDSAQSWITVVLPMLLRNEPIPTLKASIRLLRVIFTTAMEFSEFQRQVSVPNVVKFSNAVLTVCDNQTDMEIKVLCLETLECIVGAYPTTHRATSNALSSFALRHMNGSNSGSSNRGLLEAASGLYAVIPLTGGKVGAINLWRKSLEETLAFGWGAFYSLRTTFPLASQNIIRPSLADEPQVSIPLHQDRLRCSVVALCNLFSSPVQRPVQVPLGNLVEFVISLISCTTNGTIDGFIDPLVRSMEASIVPDVWVVGCELLDTVAEQFPSHLDPYVIRLLSILVTRLEEKLDVCRRLCILKPVRSILKNCHIPDSTVLTTRIAKSALYSVTKIFSPSSDSISNETEESSSKSQKSKKRSRNFEGDKVFNTTVQAVYSSSAESNSLLISLDVLQSLYKHPTLSSSMQSIIGRVVISSVVLLPRMPASSLSQDPHFIGIVTTKIQEFCLMIGSGTTSVMSKTLPLTIDAVLANSQPEMQRNIGMLLHPRVPPLVRSMPHVESLSLFKAEESQEEAETLSSLGIADLHLRSTDQMQTDIVMNDLPSSDTKSTTNIPITKIAEQEHNPIGEKGITSISQQTPEIPPSHFFASERQREKDHPSPTLHTVNATSFEGVSNISTPTPSSRPIGSVAEEEGDEEEEMPSIDMESDTDNEED